ncbi:MAG TPA: DNA translocase FtsK 4TM domain-containing protein, partial [Chloroflexota bacterium]|nr:DNA translocase FtsK 4TM domain-containing protein [Chloroflexota bacterium]
EGFLSTPLHAGLIGLLGRSAFVLPPLLALVAAVRVVRVRPPIARLLGLGILVVAVLGLEHLLAPGDGGMAGQWMAEALAAALGGIVTAVVLLCALGAGAWLTFGIHFGQK